MHEAESLCILHTIHQNTSKVKQPSIGSKSNYPNANHAVRCCLLIHQSVGPRFCPISLSSHIFLTYRFTSSSSLSAFILAVQISFPSELSYSKSRRSPSREPFVQSQQRPKLAPNDFPQTTYRSSLGYTALDNFQVRTDNV